MNFQTMAPNKARLVNPDLSGLLSLFPCFTLTSTSTLLQTLSAATAVPALESFGD
jgi:hypothetical protein